MSENFYLFPVVYLPRIKKIHEQHSGTSEGREWVAHWRRLHLKTQPNEGGHQEAVSASIASIYRNAGYAVPEKIYFESGDRSFLKRSLLGLSGHYKISRSVDSQPGVEAGTKGLR